jgi:hypothetical protein
VLVREIEVLHNWEFGLGEVLAEQHNLELVLEQALHSLELELEEELEEQSKLELDLVLGLHSSVLALVLEQNLVEEAGLEHKWQLGQYTMEVRELVLKEHYKKEREGRHMKA